MKEHGVSQDFKVGLGELVQIDGSPVGWPSPFFVTSIRSYSAKHLCGCFGVFFPPFNL